MRISRGGAQRASSHRLVALLATLMLASMATAPTATAVTNTADAPWLTVEEYYLTLVNCTRTGGWVRTDGSCAGYGSGRYSKYVAPLKWHPTISTKVSRPWAKSLAVNAKCLHGDVGARLRKAGYTNYRWGENIGCRDGYSTAKAAVLASHLKFQSEKSSRGGHWVNIKNSAFKYIGIGIWRSGSRTRLVTDFYTP